MSSIVKSHIFAIIFINTGSGSHRTSEISADIFNCDIGSIEVGPGTDIESVSVKDTDKTGSKVFRFVHFRKQTQNDIADRKEKTVKECSVMKEINAEFIRNGKNTVSVYTGNEFAGHMKGTHLVIFVSAGRTKTAFTAERDEFHGATAGTGKHGATVRGGTTMNHLADIFNNSRTGMKELIYG